ncbi:hypothetical protein FKR81_00825 [Lentzea tibetensis]|uniref:Uncharacterized protein n=1 Tax=Lentzea tibetensis TaxID=2591470 RepID=A0A563F450_9PSEU|nr:hypothetical protein [Lentzea tibetensis]TWP54144.1 hypothetical protein FKR81_00825 [Lentzea tibetensis]
MATEWSGEHPAVDPALMADARARSQSRAQSWEVLDPEATRRGKLPLPMTFKPKIITLAVAGALLVTTAVYIGTLGDSDDNPAGIAQQTGTGNGYIPGVIDPQIPSSGQQSSTAPATSSSQPPGSSATPTNPIVKPPAGPAYSGTAGPGCGGFNGVGTFRDGREGWVDHGDGKCGSAFVSIPMSGSATKDDSSAYGLWTFSTGAVSSGTCALSVFIPNGDLQEVGGNPTSYRVFGGHQPSGSPLGSFEIKQVDQRGKWVGVGSYKVTDGKLALQLLTRGQDWNGSGATYAHHAASAVKADCKA